MQYGIPQFIEVEDKVVGPLTIRQFGILLGGALLTAAGYAVFDFELFLFMGVIIIGISSLFAFLKINGRSFDVFIIAFVKYTFGPKLRLWAKETKMPSETITNTQKRTVRLKEDYKSEVTKSKLEELSTLLDTSARFYAESSESKQTTDNQ